MRHISKIKEYNLKMKFLESKVTRAKINKQINFYFWRTIKVIESVVLWKKIFLRLNQKIDQSTEKTDQPARLLEQTNLILHSINLPTHSVNSVPDRWMGGCQKVRWQNQFRMRLNQKNRIYFYMIKFTKKFSKLSHQ